MARKSESVIVSNRLPVHRVKRGDRYAWETSPGGLVSALTPVLKERPSTWIGWPGHAGKPPKPFRHEGIFNQPVHLSRSETEDFLCGTRFSSRR